MRILLSSHGAGLYGAERVLIALASGMCARGWDVSVELPHDGPALAELERVAGLSVYHSRRARLPRNLWELAIYLARAPIDLVRLALYVRKGRYECVWVNSLFNPLAAIAARLAGARVVWHLHERNLKGVAGRAMAVVIDLCANEAVVISDFVARSFPLRRAQVRLLPNALLSRVPATEPAGRPFTVGYVGQFEPRKRAPDVLEAVAQVPGVQALLVGDGKARHAVDQAAADPRLTGRVHLAGFQRNAAEWYAKFDCLVIPSRDEPFGLVALEGMAAGLPIIAADSGALPEVLEDAGLYYPLGDTAALADRIRELAAQPALARELASRSRRRATRFSIDRFLDDAAAIAAG